jgi:hypothetical protein
MDRPVPPPPPPLGWGSAALLGLGVLLLGRDVLAQTTSAAGWIAALGGVVGLIVAGLWRGSSAAPGARPRRVHLLVAALLLVQVAVPLTYYGSHDPYDERFAWRMFSGVRVLECRLAAFETVDGAEREIALTQTLHVAWINLLRRNREAVQRRFLEWRCDVEGVEAVRLVNRCVGADRRVRQPVRVRRDCGAGVAPTQGPRR